MKMDENEISFTCKLNSFSYERMSFKTRFEEEAEGNSEMAFARQVENNKHKVHKFSMF